MAAVPPPNPIQQAAAAAALTMASVTIAPMDGNNYHVTIGLVDRAVSGVVTNDVSRLDAPVELSAQGTVVPGGRSFPAGTTLTHQCAYCPIPEQVLDRIFVRDRAPAAME